MKFIADNSRNFLIILLIVVIYYQATLVKKSQDQTMSYKNGIEWLQDSVKTMQDGSKQAKVLEAELTDIRKIVAAKDKKLAELSNQKGIKSGIVIKTETKYDTVYKTVVKTDTITGKPIVNESYSDAYVKWAVSLRNDSLGVKVAFKDTLSISQKEVSNGMFRGKSLVINVKSENPYSLVTDVTSFTVKPKRKSKLGLVLTHVGVAALAVWLTK